MWNSSGILQFVFNEIELMARVDWLCNLAHLGAIPLDDVLFNITVDMLLRKTRTKRQHDPVIKYGPISSKE